MVYVAVTERQATLTQVFSYGRVYLHFYEIKSSFQATQSGQKNSSQIIYGKTLGLTTAWLCPSP